MTHALKTLSEFYKDVESGIKNFELRKFDRPFKVGDKLLLQEWDGSMYTGKELYREITYILSNETVGNVNKFGLYADFGVIGMKDCDIY